MTWSWARGERYVTPSPLRKIQLNQQVRRRLKAWDAISRPFTPDSSKFVVLYAMQMQPEASVDVVRSFCFWGFYINNTSQGWDTRLFISNLDTQAGHGYDVFVLQTNTISVTSFTLPPSGIRGFSCQDLNSCGQSGWLYVQSNANIFGSTLFVINLIFGGGSFTAQSPLCEFFL